MQPTPISLSDIVVSVEISALEWRAVTAELAVLRDAAIKSRDGNFIARWGAAKSISRPVIDRVSGAVDKEIGAAQREAADSWWKNVGRYPVTPSHRPVA